MYRQVTQCNLKSFDVIGLYVLFYNQRQKEVVVCMCYPVIRGRKNNSTSSSSWHMGLLMGPIGVFHIVKVNM